MAVSIIVSGVAVLAFVMTMETYTRMVRQYEAETEMVSAIMGIRAALSTAVNVNFCGDNSSGAANNYTARVPTPANVTLGCVYTGNFTSGVAESSAYLVAMVVKDMNSDYNRSKLVGSAVYYQTPWDDIDSRQSGAIYIDQEAIDVSPAVYTAGWTKLSPVNAPFMYTRLVGFRAFDARSFTTTNNFGAVANFPIQSITYALTMRYFTKGKATDFRWFPSANMAPYRSSAGSYYDLTKEFKVTFANNAFNRSRFLSPRPYGNMHLFKHAAGHSRKN